MESNNKKPSDELYELVERLSVLCNGKSGEDIQSNLFATISRKNDIIVKQKIELEKRRLRINDLERSHKLNKHLVYSNVSNLYNLLEIFVLILENIETFKEEQQVDLLNYILTNEQRESLYAKTTVTEGMTLNINEMKKDVGKIMRVILAPLHKLLFEDETKGKKNKTKEKHNTMCTGEVALYKN